MSLKYLACTSHLPRSLDSGYSKDKFRNTYSMNIVIFNKTTSSAISKANELADSIRKKRNTLVLRNPDGTLSNEKLEFGNIQVDSPDDYQAQLAIQFTKEFNYE